MSEQIERRIAGDRRKSILDTAQEVIYGDREKTYGNPAKNLTVIAEFWNTYIRASHSVEAGLTAEDVCVMMTLLKAARLANQIDHKDSQVDSCGYMALLERIQEHQQSVAKQTNGGSNEVNKSSSRQLVNCSEGFGSSLCGYPNCACSKTTLK